MILRLKKGYHDIQAGNTTKLERENVVCRDTNRSIPLYGSQLDVQALERIFTDRLRCFEMDNVATVETIVNDATLAAMDSWGIHRVELTSSRRDPRRVIVDPDQRVFSGSVLMPQSLPMTTLIRVISNNDLNRVDETRGLFYRSGTWFVSQRNKLWPANTHSSQKCFLLEHTWIEFKSTSLLL